ncbi:hypothetical protein INR49_007707 [Caranx melampygus]|nr:hypothetical protein INR49_007707 [Caranx melampygus]
MNPLIRRKLPASVRNLLTDIGPKEEWTDAEPEAVTRDGILLPSRADASRQEELLTPAKAKEEEEEGGNAGRNVICMLCKIKPSCYTCPRCNLHYCGLPCYQSPDHSVCSEEFYKESVLKELKDMGKTESEGRKKMQEILVGLRQKAERTDGGMESLLKEAGIVSDDADRGEDEATEKVQIGRGELLSGDVDEEAKSTAEEQDLADRLSGLDVDKLSEEELWEILNSKEKETFMNLMKSGALAGLVPLWKPWWEEHSKGGRALVEELNKQEREDSTTVEALNSSKVFSSIQEALDCGETLILSGGYLDKEDHLAPARAVEAVAHIMTGKDGKDATGYCLAALSQLRSVLSHARSSLSKEGEEGEKRQKYFLGSKKCEFFQAWVLDNAHQIRRLALELWTEHGKRESVRDSMEKAKTVVEENLKKGKRRTNRTGPPLSRLYSGALGSRRTGACSRLVSPAASSSCVGPYVVPSVRGYAVVTEKKDEASVAVRSQQAQQFDWALTKLDTSVRRTGRITKTLLLRIFHDICRAGYPSGNQALLLLRSCGSLLPEMPQEERTVLAHRVWEKLQELGAQYDVSHYNALLKVYLQNDFKFSPTDFLAKMEAANVQPNRVTYQRLIAAYCQNGDIEGAGTILGFMKSKDLPITEAVFNSLVTGHARAGDMESAKNILSVMRGAGIEPGPDTYVSLLTAYAEKGDMDSVKKTMEAAESADCGLTDRDIMQVIFALAKAGHHQHTPQMVEYLKQERGYMPDAMNLCLSLITQKQEDTAFDIMKSFLTVQAGGLTSDSPNLGNFFLRHCVNMDTAVEKIMRYCKALQESNLHLSPLVFSVQCALEAKNTGVLEVMKGMKELGVVRSFLPALDHNSFRGSLIQGFRKSDDVESMVKITDLLYKDKRFSKETSNPVDSVSFFLYNLIDSMSEQEVQAQEDKLRSFFIQLQSRNITISLNIYRGIRNVLRSCHVPELIKDVITLVDPKERASIGTAAPRPTGIEFKLQSLEKKLVDLKAENKPISSVLKQTIQTLCAEENLQRALELKQQYEDEMTVGSYVTLISQCCQHGNVEEALNLKRELGRKDSSIVMDASKYIALVKMLSKNDRVDDALDILKEMKEKEVPMSDANVTMLFHVLNAVVTKGGVPVIQQLQDTIFTLGLAKPSANFCSPLITAYLHRNDLPGALEAAMECQKRYKHMPRIHDILVGLVEKGDTDLLQKAMDFMSQERGEMNMLYDLCFAFLQTGRYREARKIIETPGLRARPGRLQWYAEKCISGNQMETLEQMVDMTAKLFECDRDEMYSYILRLCKETYNWEKAEAVWTKMQEENVIPRERTLRLLADILRSNGQEVPFEVPETWYEKAATTQQVKAPATPTIGANMTDYQLRLSALCKKGKAKEAFAMLKKADKIGVQLTPAAYDHLIRALLAEGSVKDAMTVNDMAVSRMPSFELSNLANSLLVISYSKKGETKNALEKLKSMMQVDHVPSRLAITRLAQALGSSGDLAGIQELQSLLKGLGTTMNLSSMLFVNNTAMGHINNGDVESAVELLESFYTSPDSNNDSMSFVFRKVLEQDDDKVLDKFFSHDNVGVSPEPDHHRGLREKPDPQQIHSDRETTTSRCNAVAEQKEVLMSYMTKKAQTPGQVGKIKALLSLIPDFVEKDVVCTYLMKCHALDKDLPSAKALYEQMQKEGMVTDELFLKRLAKLYRDAGEPVPFVEPPMKRDNLVGEWRLFRQSPGGLRCCLLLERGEIEAGVLQVLRRKAERDEFWQSQDDSGGIKKIHPRLLFPPSKSHCFLLMSLSFFYIKLFELKF